MSNTLAEFLLERIAEDEAHDGWHTVECGVGLGYWATGRCICGYPARILADCEAKRRIVAWVNQWPWRAEPPSSVDGLLPLLALPYADHPDYRPEWRP